MIGNVYYGIVKQMVFLISVIVIFLISFIWAYFSLKKDVSRPKEVKHAQKELLREKILFQKD